MFRACLTGHTESIHVNALGVDTHIHTSNGQPYQCQGLEPFQETRQALAFGQHVPFKNIAVVYSSWQNVYS